MRKLKHLFDNNQAWVDKVNGKDPDFFQQLAQQQAPEYLWIGCADSRVPANQIINLKPGEIFVHRNVANLVPHSDLNSLSVIQFAVEVLKVKHIIVCGHYRCGGVLAALSEQRLGMIENWIGHIVDVRKKYDPVLQSLDSDESRADTLCELNVIEQVTNVCSTTVLKDAWERGQDVAVHGWIYDIADGLLRDLRMCVTRPEELSDALENAIIQLPSACSPR